MAWNSPRRSRLAQLSTICCTGGCRAGSRFQGCCGGFDMLPSPPPGAPPQPHHRQGGRRPEELEAAAQRVPVCCLGGGVLSTRSGRRWARGGGARGSVPVIIGRAQARRLHCLAVRVVILCALASTSPQMPWSSPAPLGVGTRPAGGLIHQAAPRPAAHVLYGVCGCSCASPWIPAPIISFRILPSPLQFTDAFSSSH